MCKRNVCRIMSVIISLLIVCTFNSCNSEETGSGEIPMQENVSEKKNYTYADIVNKLIDLESLAIAPLEGEKSAEFTSYNRNSKYDDDNDKYISWSHNHDVDDVIRIQEDGGKVMAEMDGPGYITRIWSASPKTGHVKIFIDGENTPVIDLPFIDYFTNVNDAFKYESLCYEAALGYNFYVPITYNKSCKVVAYDNWGEYYHINYYTLPSDKTVESFSADMSQQNKEALSKVNDVLGNKLGSDPFGKRIGEETISKKATVKQGDAFSCQIEGKKAITGIIIKLDNISDEDGADWEALSDLSINMYWDGESKPSVSAPLGQFFGSASGFYEFSSLISGISKDGSMYSYWYMPFKDGAKLTIKNDGDQDYTFNCEITSSPYNTPNELLRFHAKWSRQGYAEEREKWPDYSILNTKGKGRFVGLALHAYKHDFRVDPKSADGGAWWGEGDEKFFVDGEKFPSWFGTGTEDYFGYAWGSDLLFSKPFHSQPYCKGGSNGIGNRMLNRYQIIDNIPFQKSFDGYIEKYYSDDYINYGITSFWYLSTDGEDKYNEADIDERTNYFEIPYKLKPGDFYEFDDMTIISVNDGNTSIQNMSRFNKYERKWSLGQQLFWTGGMPGSSILFELLAPEDGEYEIYVNLTTALDYGNAVFYINDKQIGNEIDLYSKEVDNTEEMLLGKASLNNGANNLKVEISGKNSNSIGYLIGLDYIRLKKV